MPRIRELNVNEKALVNTSAEIRALYRALRSFEFIMLEHVRNARNPNEARSRAGIITENLKTSISTVLGAIEPPAAGAAQAQAARISADNFARCPVGTVWDPITETCV